MSSLARIPGETIADHESPRLAGAERFLREALDAPSRPLASRERLRIVTIAAPVARPTALLDVTMGDETALLFDPPEGRRQAAIGAAAELRVSGEGRFAALREAAAALFAGLGELREPGVGPSIAPRLFGGFAFAPGEDHGEAWEGFGDGLFVLPRWVYTSSGERASLSLATTPGGGAAEVERAVAELRRIWDRLLSGAPARPERGPRTTSVAHHPLADWTAQVEAIRAAIRAGDVAKVVAARRATVELDRPVTPAALLDRLKARFPLCTSFALVREGAAFLGATPETLVERRGPVVTTEALAGSMARGRASDLLASRKDREEHRLVVDAIVEALRPHCSQVAVGSEPRIRDLPNLLHIHTPIEGRARDGVDVLGLVEALHPTPAVGGVPTTDATRWIAAHEAAPRGWYGAPFGWFDATGDGAFVVALRSGLVRGHRVHVYAGAGIVRDSDPLAEYEETALKMQALLGALDEDERA